MSPHSGYKGLGILPGLADNIEVGKDQCPRAGLSLTYHGLPCEVVCSNHTYTIYSYTQDLLIPYELIVSYYLTPVTPNLFHPLSKLNSFQVCVCIYVCVCVWSLSTCVEIETTWTLVFTEKQSGSDVTIPTWVTSQCVSILK